MSIHEHFARDYVGAREKFLEAIGPHSVRLRSVQNPLRGPRGERLFCDVAWHGPADAERVLVTISATHGVEGFCGSGCQTAWFATGAFRELPPGVAQLHLHAVNPHGFAWLRRVNEDNVDLNRNFVTHIGPYPENPGYEKLAPAVAPNEWTTAAQAASKAVMADYTKRFGAAAFQSAVSGGQYTHPDGIFFGGHAPTWSHRIIASAFRDWLARAKHVAIVDFHTELGPRGYGEIIFALPDKHSGFARALDWYGSDLTSTEMGTSTSAPLVGTNGDGFVRFLPGAQLTAVALEYGTLPLDDVLDAVRADNWLHFHGDLASEDSRRIKTQMRDAFAPNDPAWRQSVWTRAEEVLRKTAFGLARS
ncbi:MAG: DUF2817 domain-containing protein [Alphaproteobacteria bacterium]|nr:DUF2817 domain-containing protein [Alphaproteobacteria bacterium]